MDAEELTREATVADSAPLRDCHAAPHAEVENYLADLDTQLMLQYCRGETHAANALIRRNIDRVARFVARVVRDPRVVEDLVQDVFLRVITRAGTYVPTARFSTWLYRIATHVALNHLRERAAERRKSFAPLGDLDLPDSAAPRPDHALNLVELRSTLATLMGELPPNQRIAMVLCDTEDFSYKQIAAILSVSVESVRALLLRARTALRRRLPTVL